MIGENVDSTLRITFSKSDLCLKASLRERERERETERENGRKWVEKLTQPLTIKACTDMRVRNSSYGLSVRPVRTLVKVGTHWESRPLARPDTAANTRFLPSPFRL